MGPDPEPASVATDGSEVDLSVCLLGMNGREITLRCLTSIVQGGGANGIRYEVLYLDNGSTDGVVAEVRARFPSVVVIEMGRNAGFPVPYNLAFARMRGRHGLVLNNDTIIVAGALETAVRYLDAHPDVGILGAGLLNPDGSRQNAVHNFPTLLPELVPHSLLKMLFPARFPSRRQEHAAPVDVECVLGAFMMFPRTLLARVGGLDEGFFIYLEESDWCLRARRAGLRVVHHPHVAVYHIHGVTTGQVRVAGKIEFARSKYRYFRKNLGLGASTALMGLTLAKLVRDVLVALLACAATLGAWRTARGKLRQYGYLLAWHLLLMPRSWGLATGRPDDWSRVVIPGWKGGDAAGAGRASVPDALPPPA